MSRPADITFSSPLTLPAWAHALSKELSSPSEHPTELTPLAALEELSATLRAVCDGGLEPLRKPDMQSLLEDVEAALEGIGPAYAVAAPRYVRQLLDQDLARVQQTMASIGKARSGTAVQGSANSHPETELREVADRVDRLRADLASRAILQAALLDVIEAFKTSASADDCWLRVAQFGELAQAVGHEWRKGFGRLGDRIAKVLVDSPLAVQQETGRLQTEPLNYAPSGLPFEDRLRLAIDTVVVSDPPEADVVVWLVFYSAFIERGMLDLGPIQLFDGGYWPLWATGWSNAPPGYVVPPELADDDVVSCFGDESLHGCVLARAHLGKTTLANAGARAREVLEGLLTLYDPNTRWRIAREAVVCGDGSARSMSHFRDPLEWEQANASFSAKTNPHADRTGAFLAEAGDTATRLIAGHEATNDAFAELRYLKAAREAIDPAQRLTLRWRSLERVLPTGHAGVAGKSVLELACEYLRDRWVFRQVQDQIFDAAHAGTYGLPEREGANKVLFVRCHQALAPGKGQSVRNERAIEVCRDVAPHLPQGGMQRRMVDVVLEWADDGAKLGALFDQERAQFNKLAARALRQRNATPHGRPTVSAVVATVERFVERLASHSVYALIDAAEQGAVRPSRADLLETERDEYRELLADLASGKRTWGDLV